ncbi:MAG: NAD-dependent epimerase/dehydratase family protein [Chitinivibrionales bacterium]|nr:NAD-dependent epimerase/dehydratase family protein [Chitinivibrionales bacterium]MBD3356580.1 NAD-dependent epimerase/dehydratase family protein [Chitinivibrionales bacterium]
MVLVTGGTGVMGSVLVRMLAESGKRVRVFALPNDPGIPRVREWTTEIRTGSIANKDDVFGLCEGMETVYHLAAVIIASDPDIYRKVNVAGTRYVVRDAVKHGVKHFIHVSSASVVYPKATPYSLSKRECERIVRSSGLTYTIVRPTLVYDRRGGLEFDLFLDYLRRFPVIPFIGAGRALKRPVFAGDLVEGLRAIADNNRTGGKTYNLSGGEALSMRDFARLCLRLTGTPHKPIIPIPVWLCTIAARLLSRFMRNPPLRWPVIAGVTQDADLDPSEAIVDLGYCPAKVTEKLPECFPRVV